MIKKIKILIRDIRGAWKRATKRYDDSLSWELGYYSIEQMKYGLDYFLKDAPKIVDLTYHHITYRDKEYTLEELLKLFQQITDYVYHNFDEVRWTSDKNFEKIFFENLDAYYELHKLLLFYLWW